MEQNQLDRALKNILKFSHHFNEYFQHKEPWKKGSGTNLCVQLSIRAVRSIAIALYSFLPDSAEKICLQLGMNTKISDEKWESMSEINDSIKPGHKIGSISPLFKKIEEADIKKYKQKLGSQN